MDNGVDAQVLIVDAGAQYGQVINRRIRELGISTVFLPLNTPFEELQKYRPSLRLLLVL